MSSASQSLSSPVDPEAPLELLLEAEEELKRENDVLNKKAEEVSQAVLKNGYVNLDI